MAMMTPCPGLKRSPQLVVQQIHLQPLETQLHLEGQQMRQTILQLCHQPRYFQHQLLHFIWQLLNFGMIADLLL